MASTPRGRYGVAPTPAVSSTAPTLPLFCLQPARAWLTVELTCPACLARHQERRAPPAATVQATRKGYPHRTALHDAAARPLAWQTSFIEVLICARALPASA